MPPDRQTPWLAALLAATIVALIVSGWHPYDRATWLLEVLPVCAAIS